MERINDRDGIRGWLLLLCLILLVWQPVTLALEAAAALDALAIRGPVLGFVLLGRVTIAAVGVAAGLALLGRRPGAVSLAKWSLVLSAVVDVFVETTSFVPTNRLPGTTPLLVGWSIIFYAGWLAYLFRSQRVKNTF